MRNLTNPDLFKIMRIIRKTNFKKRILELDVPKDEETGKILLSDQEYWILLLMELIEGAPDAEKEVFKFLADVAEVSQKEIENDEFEILVDVIEHLKNQEKFRTFLEKAFDSVQ